MLKHVHLSPYRSSMMSSSTGHSSKADTLSLNSTMSYSSLSHEPLSSRSSSYTSLSEPHPPQTTMLKVFARCLRPDIEYKTLSISHQTTCKELILMLLNKAKMKHRDPKLFYLTMEVGVRKTGVPVRTLIVLDDESRPAELQSCHPRGSSRFCLQMRRGGLVRVYDSVLMSASQYKSLLISERTNVDNLITLLLNCNSSKERVERFSLYEVCKTSSYERKLHPDDCPLHVQIAWPDPAQYAFVLRRNPEFPNLSRRGLPWSKSLDSSLASDDSASSTSQRSDSSLSKSSSYHDYENYFYI